MTPVIIDDTIRVELPVGNSTVTFICERPGARDLSQFLSSRVRTHRNKMQNRTYEARQEFFRKIIIDLENAQFRAADRTLKALSKDTVLSDEDKKFWGAKFGQRIESWIDLIPVNWISAVCMHFEQAEAEGDEHAKGGGESEDGEGN